jgi:sugar phosphate permease
MSDKDDLSVNVRNIDSSEDKELAKVIDNKNADVALKLFEEFESIAGELTPEAEKKLQWKLWLRIFPMVFAVNFLLFMDKNTMGYATLLDLFEDANLDQQKYNDLQTTFYVGYMVGQIPSHIVFQKVKLSHYVTGVTFIWSFVTLIQLTCKNFSGLAAIRFFLGLFESGMTPCLEHTIAMWFTPEEQAIVNPVFWVSCLAQGIPGGLISYGVQFIPNVRPWKGYWGIIGGASFILSVSSFFFYPDNPASYKYFTPIERVQVINRIKKATNSSIEQKVIKKEQIYEALKDPITWLFGLFVFINMFSNNVNFQSAIIYKQLGFSNLQSTLVSVASAGWSIVTSTAGTTLLTIFKAQTAHVSYGILAGIF